MRERHIHITAGHGLRWTHHPLIDRGKGERGEWDERGSVEGGKEISILISTGGICPGGVLLFFIPFLLIKPTLFPYPYSLVLPPNHQPFQSAGLFFALSFSILPPSSLSHYIAFLCIAFNIPPSPLMQGLIVVLSSFCMRKFDQHHIRTHTHTYLCGLKSSE